MSYWEDVKQGIHGVIAGLFLLALLLTLLVWIFWALRKLGGFL